MGFWSRLRGIDSYDPAQRVLPAPYEPYVATGGIPVMDPGTPLEYWTNGGSSSQIEKFWSSQPNLRKVVDFIARNVASVPLNVYERRDDTDRQRVRDGILASLIGSPGERVGAYRFWHAVLSDGLLYDRWCVLIDGAHMVQIPSWRLKVQTDTLRRVTALHYWAGDQGSGAPWIEVPLDEAIFDVGYAPRTAGLSPVSTLRDVLDETAEAVRYRRDVWENGARMPGYISRPPQKPWEKEQRERFVRQMREVYGADGSNRGGMPLLEDGMEIKSNDTFSPQDAMDLEGRQLTAIEVAAAFHIAPELVGARQGNYSNVREYRQMLYRDSLGPYIRSIEDALNTQLVPRIADTRELYVEANVEAKLRGDFIEQAQVKLGAVGGPWMSINESRALDNRPPVDGGNVVLTPLNMMPLRPQGDEADEPSGSTLDGAAAAEIGRDEADTIQRLVNAAMALIRTGFLPEAALDAVGLDPIEHSGMLPVTLQTGEKSGLRMDRRAASTKAAPPANHHAKFAEVLTAFFERQSRVVQTAMGLKDDSPWWDAERWNAELAADLLRLNLLTASEVARRTATEFGYDSGDYDEERTLAFLRAVSERVARQVNDTTRAALEDALVAEAPREAVGEVFSQATGSRALQAATTALTFATAFGVIEAGRQLGGTSTTKTWVVTSGNPRPSHAAMNGQTVGIDEAFSNGAMWPADGNLSVDEVAGCECEVFVQL